MDVSLLQLALEGDQNMRPQNIACWHKDYFELKVIENQKLQEDISVLPLICLKVLPKTGINQHQDVCINRPYENSLYLPPVPPHISLSVIH